MVQKVIRREWYILQKDPKYGKMFKQTPRFIYRKGKSIGNDLVKSDIGENKFNKLSTTVKKRYFTLSKLSKLLLDYQGTRSPRQWHSKEKIWRNH